MAGAPIDLESHTLVLLRRPVDAPDLPDEELDRLQDAHLAHLGGLREAGKLLAAGPFEDQSDDSLRGMCFFAVGLDEAIELLSRDPSVRAGRLAIEAMTWFTRRGSVGFPTR